MIVNTHTHTHTLSHAHAHAHINIRLQTKPLNLQELPDAGVLTLKFKSEKSSEELPRISPQLSQRVQHAFFVRHSFETCCALLGQHASIEKHARKPRLLLAVDMRTQRDPKSNADVNVKTHEAIITAN